MNFMLLAVALTMAFIYIEAPPAGWEVILNYIKKGKNEFGDYIICEQGGNPIGDLYYKKHDAETIEITSLQVDYNRRREGVGKALLTYFIDNIAKAGGFSKIKLDHSNAGTKDAAISIYKSVGFESVGGNLMEKNL